MQEVTKQLLIYVITLVLAFALMFIAHYMHIKTKVDSGAIWCVTESGEYPVLTDRSSCVD